MRGKFWRGVWSISWTDRPRSGLAWWKWEGEKEARMASSGSSDKGHRVMVEVGCSAILKLEEEETQCEEIKHQ